MVRPTTFEQKKIEGVDSMSANSYITKITLPDSTSKLVKDIEGMHFLGTTSTNVMANEGAVTSITVGTTVYTINPTGSQEKLRANDTVLYQELLFIFTGSVWQKLTFAASTPLVDDVQVDSVSILNNKIADIKTTGASGGSGETTPYNASTNPLTTQAYVDAKVEELPQAMIFKGSLGTGGTVETLPTASATTIGDVYKVITAGEYVSGESAKVGDLYIGTKTGTSTYAWTLIPSGDEPAGTVTNVATGVGLTGGPITSTGTIKANLASETALTGDDVLAVGVNSSGNLAVKVTPRVTDGTYDASTNKIATQSTVTNAVSGLVDTLTGTPGAGKTITAFDQVDGKVSATFSNIAITTSQVTDASTTTVYGVTATSGNIVTGIASSAASSTTPADAVTGIYTYDDTTETLTLNYLTAPKTTVKSTANILQRSTS